MRSKNITAKNEFRTYCRTCGVEYSIEEAAPIVCPECEAIQDMLGNTYSNNFGYGDIVEIWDVMNARYVQARFICKCHKRKHFSIVRRLDAKYSTTSVARAALNPHID